MANKQVNTSIYDLEYFSSSSAAIYIGDVWVDEITSIEYVCRQNKTPIYGYASQLFDATSKGHVLVSGSFSINFKEQGYLWAVLKRWFKMGVEGGILSPAQGKYLLNDKRNTNANGTGGAPLKGSNGTTISRATIERLVSGTATKKERYEAYTAMAGFASYSVPNGQDKIFEDICEVFEDQVWNIGDNEILNSQLRRVDDNAFDGFDIYVVFGNMSVPNQNHTCCKLTDIRILSHGKSIAVGEAPILEVYSFLGKSVV